MSSQEEQPTPGKPATKEKAGSKSYEENPSASAQELQEAISSVPVKDYQSYEIELETKEHYDDALFNSEDELDSALNQPKQATQPTESQKSEPKAEVPIQENQNTAKYLNKDFSQFLTDSTKAESITATLTSTQSASNKAPLNISATGLNNSLVSSSIKEDNDEPDQPLIEEYIPEEGFEEAPSPPESQTLAQKIKLKAEQQFKASKANLDEYLGRSLPERELPLEFSFPIQKHKKEFDHIATGYDVRKLIEAKKSHHSLFKQAESDLAKIAKCQLSASNRQHVLDAYSPYLIEQTLDIITRFESKPNFAGDSKRLELAEACHNTFKHLISGYKQLYAGLYEAANVIYGPQRNSANKLAITLIELLFLELRLATAIHSSVPTASVKTINKLFKALSLYEPQLITMPIQSSVLHGDTSIKALYFLYQTYLALDTRNISPLLYKALHPYLLDKITLLSLVTEQYLAQQSNGKEQFNWMIKADHSSAPKLEQSGNQQTNNNETVIRVDRLLNAIEKDYRQCTEWLQANTLKPANKILAAIKPHFACTLTSALNQSVAQHRSQKFMPSFSVYEPLKIKAYPGIEQTYSYLNYQYTNERNALIKKGKAVKEAPAKPIIGKANWSFAKQVDDQLYLQTQEPTASLPLDIGQLTLFVQLPETENNSEENENTEEEQLRLGVITRSERSQQFKLNLNYRILSTNLTQAKFIAKDEPQPCLLAISEAGHLFITDHSHAFHSDMPLNFILPDDTRAIMHIDALFAVSHKVQVLLLK